VCQGVCTELRAFATARTGRWMNKPLANRRDLVHVFKRAPEKLSGKDSMFARRAGLGWVSCSS